MRLSGLRDKKLRDSNGNRLGRVHDVHVADGQVVALKCGPGSLIERMTGRDGGRLIKWSRVVSVTRREVVVE